ncbi:MAG: hypothetical protein JSS49_08375 [Planctomycetes bacterium]|nr:hypothetical protein [Planctomycetota bacterium]
MRSRHASHTQRRRLTLSLLGNWLLLFCPIPIGPMRRRLAGGVNQQGDLEFYSHPNFVCCCHVIWIGWLATVAGIYNEHAAEFAMWPLPVNWLNGLWLVAVILTLLVSGLKFDRIACGFLLAGTIIVVLLAVVLENLTRLSIRGLGWGWLRNIPLQLSWGVPCLTSLILGVVFVAVATWQSLNDRWILPSVGSYIEHVNFQQRDRSIARGAKSFIACFDCLLRRYLLFGYGDIEVRSATGNTIVDRIEGVFFATWHAERMKRRLAITDVSFNAAEAEHEEEEVESLG